MAEVTSPGTASLLDELDSLASAMASPAGAPAPAPGEAPAPAPGTSLLDELDSLASTMASPAGAPAPAPASGEAPAPAPGTSLLDELDSLASTMASPAEAPAPAPAPASGEDSTTSLLDELDAKTNAPSAPNGSGDLDSLMADLEDTAPVGSQTETNANTGSQEGGDSSDLGSLLSALDGSSGAAPAEAKASDSEGGEEAGGDLGSLLAAFGEDLAAEPVAAISSSQSSVAESPSLVAQLSSSSQSAPEPEPEQQPAPEPSSSTQPNTKLQQAVRDLYREHVPDKSSEEVEANLARYEGREDVLLQKVRKKYLQAAPTTAPSPAPTAEEGDPPEPTINLKSEWVKYVGTPVFDAAGATVDRQYYRHRVTEELTLKVPSESVREIRQEKDTERFEMDWRRAGGVMPQKEGWGSWIKRGVVETTGILVDPASLTGAATPQPQPQPQPQSQESWGSWLKKGAAKAVGVAAEAPADSNSVNNSMTREDLKARTPSVQNMMVSAVPGAPAADSGS